MGNNAISALNKAISALCNATSALSNAIRAFNVMYIKPNFTTSMIFGFSCQFYQINVSWVFLSLNFYGLHYWSIRKNERNCCSFMSGKFSIHCKSSVHPRKSTSKIAIFCASHFIDSDKQSSSTSFNISFGC